MSRLIFKPVRGAIADFDLNPIQDSKTSKVRPCIVVTNNVYNAKLSVIQVVPITQWSVKKERVITNVTLIKNKHNGLIEKSIADCLQTQPIDYTKRFVRYRGAIDAKTLQKIAQALVVVFDGERDES